MVVSAIERRGQFVGDGAQLWTLVLIRPIDPIPREVLDEDGRQPAALGDGKTEGGDIADHEVAVQGVDAGGERVERALRKRDPGLQGREGGGEILGERIVLDHAEVDIDGFNRKGPGQRVVEEPRRDGGERGHADRGELSRELGDDRRGPGRHGHTRGGR